MNAHVPSPPRLVVIVRSGISGASAAWALNPVHDVTLYEKDARPGGHTATVDVDYDGLEHSGRYRLHRLQRAQLSQPDRAVCRAWRCHARQRHELFHCRWITAGWSGAAAGCRSIFAQKRNLLQPLLSLDDPRDPALQPHLPGRSRRRTPRLTFDRRLSRLAWLLAGFHQQLSGADGGGDLVDAISADAAVSAEHFVNFFDNHRLIYRRQHQWRTVTGGSRNYLERLLSAARRTN